MSGAAGRCSLADVCRCRSLLSKFAALVISADGSCCRCLDAQVWSLPRTPAFERRGPHLAPKGSHRRVTCGDTLKTAETSSSWGALERSAVTREVGSQLPVDYSERAAPKADWPRGNSQESSAFVIDQAGTSTSGDSTLLRYHVFH